MNRIERALTNTDNRVSVFSFTQTCRILGVSAPTLRKHLQSGAISGKKIGSKWFITARAIQTALDPNGENPFNPAVLCETTIVDASQ